MNIVMIASECVPFIKTGGLADVVGALPESLADSGNELSVIIPLYSKIDKLRYRIKPYIENLCTRNGNEEFWFSVSISEQSGVKFFFIEYERYFHRYGLYNDENFNDYNDNPERFSFFCKAALQFLKDADIRPDIIHAHDWQASLALAYLKTSFLDSSFFENTAGILTIHNIAYQGKYHGDKFETLGIPWNYFISDIFEDFGGINILKAGIHFADIVTTVSPTYAKETLYTDISYGISHYLHLKGENYIGILNGVDYNVWSPEKDKYIETKFSAKKIEGKKLCKQMLQKELGLNEDDSVPLFGVIGRFTEQKGLDVLADAVIPILENMNIQIAILGSGEKYLEHFYGTLPRRYNKKAASFIGYHDKLAHMIEAGSDFFIMPSRFEPCGLNQIYSLKYGTLPIVRATGGLEDTVVQYDEKKGTGTGFKFYDLNSSALYYTIGWAVSTWYDRYLHIDKMRKQAMKTDFSWKKSASHYIELYQKALLKKGITI